jgi:hypothetical protein
MFDTTPQPPKIETMMTNPFFANVRLREDQIVYVQRAPKDFLVRLLRSMHACI